MAGAVEHGRADHAELVRLDGAEVEQQVVVVDAHGVEHPLDRGADLVVGNVVAERIENPPEVATLVDGQRDRVTAPAHHVEGAPVRLGPLGVEVGS